MSNLKIGLLIPFLGGYYALWPEIKKELEKLVEDKIIGRIKRYGEVIYPGIVDDTKSAARAESEFIKEDVDLIIVIEMGYTTSNIPINALQNIKKPIIILNTQLQYKIEKGISFKELIVGNNLCGNVELASVLKRMGKNYYVLSGLMDKDDTYEEMGEYLKATMAIKKLKDANIGFIGNSVYTGMMDLLVDEVSLKEKFGTTVVHLDINEIVQIYKSVKDKEIEDLKNELTIKYKNISLNSKQFNNSIRMAVCYKKIIEKYNLNGVANYCQATMYNSEIGIAPCLGTTICTSNGIPFSCEGDIGSLIALLMMKEITGDSVFAEFYILDYEKNAILLAHCGQGNLNYARNNSDVKIITHTLFEGPNGFGAALEFTNRAGKSAILNISPDRDGNWKMVISSGENIYAKPLQGLGVPQSWWKIDMNLDDFVKRWCYAGSSHHVAFAYGNIEDILFKIGSLLNLNVSMIK